MNDELIYAMITGVGLLFNFGLGYWKTKKFNVDAFLGILLFFKNNYSKIVGRYEEQVKDEEPLNNIIIPNKDVPVNSNVRFITNLTDVKQLNVKYNSQRDNKYNPSSACNVSSVQMALSLDYEITDDELYLMCNSEEVKETIKNNYPKDWVWIKPYFDKKNANQVLVVLLFVIKKILKKGSATISWKLTFSDIMSQIDLGFPVPILAGFTSKNKLSHFVTIIGYNVIKECFIVHDSWGNWNKRYRGEGGLNGESVEYKFDDLKPIFSNVGFIIKTN